MRKQKHCEKGKQDALLQRELELELQDAEEELEQGEEWEPNVVFPKHLQERVLEHADREDGLLQMRVFQESIGHLPRLPRDLINLLSDSYVCSGSVFLIGGLDFDVEKKSFVPSKQIFRLDHNGELEECSEMPFPRYQASCVHFEGEILVVGGYSRISYQREIEDHLSPVDFFFLNRMTSACTSICIYNIADDCWRVVDDVFNISSILLGRVSCQIFGEFIFVCGNDGRDVCLSARTLTPPNKKFTMPHRKIKGTFAAQTVLVSGLLICFSNKECSSFSSKNPESNCCGYLHMLDVAALVSGHVAKWVKLPMPPQGVSMCGHIGPDAGTRLYIFGGSSSEHKFCCEWCSPRDTSETHRYLDLAADELSWRVENNDAVNDGCSSAHVIPQRNGKVTLIGGLNSKIALVGTIEVDGRKLNAEFKRVYFSSIRVDQI